MTHQQQMEVDCPRCDGATVIKSEDSDERGGRFELEELCYVCNATGKVADKPNAGSFIGNQPNAMYTFSSDKEEVNKLSN